MQSQWCAVLLLKIHASSMPSELRGTLKQKHEHFVAAVYFHRFWDWTHRLLSLRCLSVRLGQFTEESNPWKDEALVPRASLPATTGSGCHDAHQPHLPSWKNSQKVQDVERKMVLWLELWQQFVHETNISNCCYTCQNHFSDPNCNSGSTVLNRGRVAVK